MILGIDPGLGRMGWGLVAREGSRLTPVAYGLLETQPGELGDRLRLLHEEVTRLLAEHRPDALATEKLFFTKNQTTAMDVAKALGCVLLAAAQAGVPVSDYSPPEVKLGVVGTGGADKRQVQYMVAKLLGLKDAPRPDDVADALAIAITHALKSRPAP